MGMKLNKKDLKSQIYSINKSCKELDKLDYFNMAIIYSIYLAIGGKKTFVIPLYLQDFLRESYKVAKLKIKYGDADKNNTAKIINSLYNKELNDIQIRELARYNKFDSIYSNYIWKYINDNKESFYGIDNTQMSNIINIFNNPWER